MDPFRPEIHTPAENTACSVCTVDLYAVQRVLCYIICTGGRNVNYFLNESLPMNPFQLFHIKFFPGYPQDDPGSFSFLRLNLNGLSQHIHDLPA